MKIEKQTKPELTQLAKLVDGIRVAMLTNAGDAGELRSRPMAPLQLDSDGAIWFFTNEFSGKTHHLNAVNVAFVDVEKSTYVALSGSGALVDDKAKIRDLWTAFAKPWFPEGPDTPELTLLKFAPHSAEYWDSPNSRMVRLLAMAASNVAGRPVGLGDHGTLRDLG